MGDFSENFLSRGDEIIDVRIEFTISFWNSFKRMSQASCMCAKNFLHSEYRLFQQLRSIKFHFDTIPLTFRSECNHVFCECSSQMRFVTLSTFHKGSFLLTTGFPCFPILSMRYQLQWKRSYAKIFVNKTVVFLCFHVVKIIFFPDVLSRSRSSSAGVGVALDCPSKRN